MATTMIRRIRTTAASLAVIGVLAVVSPISASAGEAEFVVTPTSLHAGESLTASSNCEYPHVVVRLTEGTESIYVDPTGAEITRVEAPVPEDGYWSADVTVPDGTPPGAYTLSARCVDEGESYRLINVAITVLPNDVTTTTTTVAPTTTTVAPTTTGAKTTTTVPSKATQPAAAVAGTPNYTG